MSCQFGPRSRGSCYTSKSIPLRLDGGTHSLALLWRALLGALAYVSKKVSAFWYRCLHSVRVGFLLRDFSAASLQERHLSDDDDHRDCFEEVASSKHC